MVSLLVQILYRGRLWVNASTKDGAPVSDDQLSGGEEAGSRKQEAFRRILGAAGVGTLALHEAHYQAALSQKLTAMSVEALRGIDASIEPFFGHFRPHPGQVDLARNIFAFVAGSKFVYRAMAQRSRP